MPTTVAKLGRREKNLSYRPAPVLASPCLEGEPPLPRMSCPRRPHRLGEWKQAKAVTFILTLAGTQTVTLAARRAGMSRKSACTFKSRNEGDEVGELGEPPISPPQGDSPITNFDADLLNHFFARLAANRRDSAGGDARMR